MRLRNKLIVTVLFQLIGSASAVLVNVVVARRYGPVGQGYLIYYRSAVDLLMYIGLFGFPQAFTYLINAGTLSVDWAVKFSNRYIVLFGVLLVMAAYSSHFFGLAEKHGFNFLAVMSLAVAALGMTLHGMYRAICLSTKSNYLFNAVSIMPAVATFLIYLFWSTTDYRLLVLASVVASVVSVLFAMVLFREHFTGQWVFEKALAVSAARYGFWSFVPSVAASSAVVGTYTILRQGGASEAISGNFSISLLFITAGILPLNMVAPILFNDWAGERWREGALRSYSYLSHLGLVVSIAGIVLAVVFVEPITRIVFGDKFAGSTASTCVLLFGLFPFYQNRLLSPISLAVGYPSATAVSSLVRTVTILSILYVGFSSSLAKTALAWVIGEFLCMFYMCWVVAQKTGWPVTQVAGISPSWVFGKIKSIQLTT